MSYDGWWWRTCTKCIGQGTQLPQVTVRIIQLVFCFPPSLLLGESLDCFAEASRLADLTWYRLKDREKMLSVSNLQADAIEAIASA